MNIITRTFDLFVDQRKFFNEGKIQKIWPALLIILLSAIISGIYCWISLTQVTTTTPPLGMISGILSGISIVGAVIGTVVIWIIDSLVFFICLKIFGHSDCRFSDILKICGYATGIAILHTVILILVSFIGQPAPFALLLLSLVFLAWQVPVWFFGFKSLSPKMTRKELMPSVLVPVIIFAIVTLFTSGIFT